MWADPPTGVTIGKVVGDFLPAIPASALGSISAATTAGWQQIFIPFVGLDAAGHLVVSPPALYSHWNIVAGTLTSGGVPIDPSWVGKRGWWITSDSILSVKGETPPIAPPPKVRVQCQQCGYGDHFTAVNQPDGTFVCYSCREDPYAASFTNGEW